MSIIEIRCEDDRLLTGEWVRATGSSEPTATVVIHSATGVRRSYYEAFANYLSEHGVDALLWDARGIGDSATLPVRDDPATLLEWGQLDQQAVLGFVKAAHPQRYMIILGHSSGGNLSGLAPLTASADGLILIASGGCYWRDYPVLQQIKMLMVWRIAMPPVLKLWGYLPAWSGIGHALPHDVAKQWRKWSLMRGYIYQDSNIDTQAYAKYAGPLLALSMSDDKGYAPLNCVKTLLAAFSQANIEHTEIPASLGARGKIGHFGFFKSKNRELWPQVVDWLHERGFSKPS